MIKKRNGSDVGEPRPAQRLTMLRGTSALVRGKGTAHWGDLFYVLLTIPWWAFLGLTALAFVGVNSAFALLYLLDPEGVEHARPGSFSDAFFFSVQTLGTLGYGTFDLQVPGAAVNLGKIPYVGSPDNTYLQISHLLWGASGPPKPKKIALSGQIAQPARPGEAPSGPPSNITVAGEMDG